MGEYNFNRRQCVRALWNIGFVLCNKRRRSGHDKFCSPENIKIEKGHRSFITVPRGELKCQNAIITELRKMGGDEMVKKFRDNL